MSQGFIVVIPARYASTRLPGKPLADIAGRPMIQWTYETARASKAREVIIATDDERIAAPCRAFGARVEMTASDHANGTERIAELIERCRWSEEQIVVNVQSDEPLLPPELVTQVGRVLERDRSADIGTLAIAPASDAEWREANTAKVVVDARGHALYFSRAPIPWPRDNVAMPESALRHVGLYAYRVAALRKLVAGGPCVLEEIEALEQLRALWLGLRIAVERAEHAAPRAVDTGEDLAAVRAIVAQREQQLRAR